MVYEQSTISSFIRMGDPPEDHVCTGQIVVRLHRCCSYCGRYCELGYINRRDVDTALDHLMRVHSHDRGEIRDLGL